MADTKIGFEATLDAGNVEKSVKSIRQELREAQNEAINLARKFGDTSTEAITAAQKVAKLKDEVGDFKDRVKALDPDKKFTAFSQSLQGVAGGFAGLQGAIGLFGTESKDLEKQLLKVQSALALSEGINSILASKDAFKNMGVVGVQAFKAIKGAIGATGIGLLLVALGTIYAYWDDIKGAVSGVSEEQKKLSADSNKAVESEKKKLDTISASENILKQQGMSEKDILKSKIKQTDEAIKVGEVQIQTQIALVKSQTIAAKRNRDILEGVLKFLTVPITVLLKTVDMVGVALGKDFGLEKKFFGGLANMVFDPKQVEADGNAVLEEQKKNLLALKNNKAGYQLQIKQGDEQASQKAIEKQKKYDEDNAKYSKELQLAKLSDREKERKQLQFEEEEAIKGLDGNEKAAADVKAIYGLKRIELDKKFTEEDKKTAQELQDFKDKLALDAITNKDLRDKKQREGELAKKITEIEESKLSVVEKEKAIQDAKDAFKFEQDAKDFQAQLDKDAAAIAKTEGDFANDLAILDAQKQRILAMEDDAEGKRTKLLDENSKARRSIEDAEAEHKKKQVGETIKLLGDLGSIVGQQTAAGKALGIATALINTYQGATEALKEKSTLPQPFSTIARFASAAAIIANGIRTVKQITSVKVPGGGGGGGGQSGSNPISGGVAATQAPIASAIQVTQASLTQGGNNVNIQNQGAIKAFVVERDITDSQDRISKIKSAATF